MSKVDAMRALREARRTAASTEPAPRVAARAAAPAERPAVAVEAPSVAEGLCGHRNMGGRSCTREADHVKNGTKNHRYG